MRWRGRRLGIFAIGSLAAGSLAFGLLAIGSFAIGVSTAHAADATDAGTLVRKGMEAAGAKRWTECIDALTAAAALEDVPRTWGELGLCEEQTGRFAAAHDHLFRAMESAPTQGKKEPWTRYQAALARVKERVAVVIVTTSPPNAKVVLDGRPLGAADGRAFAVEPGSHTIGARLAGYADRVETRTMRARDVPTFHFQLEPLPAVLPLVTGAPSSGADIAGPPPVPRSALFSQLFVPGWTPRGFLVGLTYAGAATTLISGGTWIGLELDRQSLRSQVTGNACGPEGATPRPSVCTDLLMRHQQRDVAAMVTIGAGITTGALAVASAIAITLEWRSLRTSVIPVASPRGGGVVVGGVW